MAQSSATKTLLALYEKQKIYACGLVEQRRQRSKEPGEVGERNYGFPSISSFTLYKSKL